MNDRKSENHKSISQYLNFLVFVVHEGCDSHWWVNEVGHTGGWMATNRLKEARRSGKTPYREAVPPQGVIV